MNEDITVLWDVDRQKALDFMLSELDKDERLMEIYGHLRQKQQDSPLVDTYCNAVLLRASEETDAPDPWQVECKNCGESVTIKTDTAHKEYSPAGKCPNCGRHTVMWFDVRSGKWRRSIEIARAG